MNEEMEIKKQEQEGCNRVVDVIKKTHTKMRPKWYFVAQAGLIIIAATMLFLLLLYVVSFIIFALHQDGAWFAPHLGFSGWSLFFTALPWGLLLFSLILLLLLANLLKRYTFVYHQPVFYLLIAFIVIVTLGGFFVAATSLHKGLSHYAENNIPFLGSFYENETALPASVHRGEIIAFTNNNGGFVIENEFGATSTVVAAAGVVFVGDLNIGDTVLVFGPQQDGGVITAFGIQRVAIATSTGPFIREE
jgi:hypothetical protein